MKRCIVSLALFLASMTAFAQNPGQATVTATKSTYAGGQVTATFIAQGTGSPTSTVVTGAINPNGFFSVLVWNNTLNAYFPSVTQFQICAAAPNNSICYTATVTITGNQDITSAFNAAPNPGNGGNNGGGIPSLTPGVIPKSTGTSLANSSIDDGITTPNTVTSSASGGYAGKSFNSTDGIHNGFTAYGTGSGGDSTCPAPVSQISYVCSMNYGLSASINGAAYAPFTTNTAVGTVTWNSSGTCTYAAAGANIGFGTVTTTSGQTCTLSPTGLVAGGSYTLEIVNAASSAATLTLGTAGSCSAWKVSGGGSGAISLSGSSEIDVLAFIFDGTNCLANFKGNFS